MKFAFFYASYIVAFEFLLLFIEIAEASFNAVDSRHSSFYFFKLYPVAHMLYLEICSAAESEVTVLIEKSKISGFVYKFRVAFVQRILYKAFFIFFGKFVVSERKRSTSYDDHSCLAFFCNALIIIIQQKNIFIREVFSYGYTF